MNSPNSRADPGDTALPGAMRSSPQGEAGANAAKRRGNDRRVPIKTVAWPLSLAFMTLITYASLYPFADWRNQGISPLVFLTAPLPRYWSGFDVAANVLGYAPLGFLLALTGLRSGYSRWAALLAVCGSGLLSLGLETLQSYLPSRVPSNADLVLNIVGSAVGAYVAWVLENLGALGRWARLRERWLAPDARGAVVLLVLWPIALLFPAAVPMGLGQILERLEAALALALVDTPFLVWLPVREIELQPLVPLAELVCVGLGALIPLLLGYGVVRTLWRRAVFALAMLAAGVAVSALSAALSYGPEHAWAWLDLPVRVGLALAGAVAVLLLALGRRGAAALGLLALTIQLSLLNQAPASPYFAQTLQTWEQGQFIRFHGLAQWLGWLWPYATLLYLMVMLSGRERPSGGKT